MFRWIIGIALIALSFQIIVGRWYAGFWENRRPNNDAIAEYYSLIPLVCGLIGAAGFLIVPMPQLRAYWWVPLVVDPGGILLVGAGLIDMTWRVLTNRSDESRPYEHGRKCQEQRSVDGKK